MGSIVRFWINLVIGLSILGAGNGLLELTKYIGRKAVKAHKQGFYSVVKYNKRLDK